MKRETICLQTCLSKDSYFKLIHAVLRAHLLHASYPRNIMSSLLVFAVENGKIGIFLHSRITF